MWPLRAVNGTSRSAARTARTRSAGWAKSSTTSVGCPQRKPHDDAALHRTAAVARGCAISRRSGDLQWLRPSPAPGPRIRRVPGDGGAAASAAATKKLSMTPPYTPDLPCPSTTISCTVRSLATFVLCSAVLALLPLPTSSAQQRAPVQGRVVIDTPSTAKRPTSAYPNRTVTRGDAGAAVGSAQRGGVPEGRAGARRWRRRASASASANETFLPRVVAVPVGSEVEFPNDDPSTTTSFRCPAPRRSTSGAIRRGRRASCASTSPASSRCSATSTRTCRRPWWSSTIRGTRFPTTTDGSRLPTSPRATVQLVAWHERLGNTTMPVRVEPGRGASVEFTLPVPAP